MLNGKSGTWVGSGVEVGESVEDTGVDVEGTVGGTAVVEATEVGDPVKPEAAASVEGAGVAKIARTAVGCAWSRPVGVEVAGLEAGTVAGITGAVAGAEVTSLPGVIVLIDAAA